LFFISDSFCQSNEKANSFFEATFCEKIADKENAGIIFTLDEFQKCDMKVKMVDENYLVSSFKLTIMPKENSIDPIEHEIIGSIISEGVREQIVSNAKSVFLEYIKAKNSSGEIVPGRPIKIIIKS